MRFGKEDIEGLAQVALLVLEGINKREGFPESPTLKKKFRCPHDGATNVQRIKAILNAAITSLTLDGKTIHVTGNSEDLKRYRPGDEPRIGSCIYGGDKRPVKYKVIGPVTRSSSTKKTLLRLLILRPSIYKDGNRNLYSHKAYLLTSDFSLPAIDLLNFYCQRWAIEVNHRAAKTNAKIGQAQPRSIKSVCGVHPALAAAFGGVMGRRDPRSVPWCRGPVFLQAMGWDEQEECRETPRWPQLGRVATSSAHPFEVFVTPKYQQPSLPSFGVYRHHLAHNASDQPIERNMIHSPSLWSGDLAVVRTPLRGCPRYR